MAELLTEHEYNYFIGKINLYLLATMRIPIHQFLQIFTMHDLVSIYTYSNISIRKNSDLYDSHVNLEN